MSDIKVRLWLVTPAAVIVIACLIGTPFVVGPVSMHRIGLFAAVFLAMASVIPGGRRGLFWGLPPLRLIPLAGVPVALVACFMSSLVYAEPTERSTAFALTGAAWHATGIPAATTTAGDLASAAIRLANDAATTTVSQGGFIMTAAADATIGASNQLVTVVAPKLEVAAVQMQDAAISLAEATRTKFNAVIPLIAPAAQAVSDRALAASDLAAAQVQEVAMSFAEATRTQLNAIIPPTAQVISDRTLAASNLAAAQVQEVAMSFAEATRTQINGIIPQAAQASGDKTLAASDVAGAIVSAVVGDVTFQLAGYLLALGQEAMESAAALEATQAIPAARARPEYSLSRLPPGFGSGGTN